MGEQSEEGGSQVCPVSGALGSEDSWVLRGEAVWQAWLCSWVGCSRVTCRVGLRKPVCAVTPAVCDEGWVSRDRQDPLGELPAASRSLLPPRDVRCTKVRVSPHLTCPGEGQGRCLTLFALSPVNACSVTRIGRRGQGAADPSNSPPPRSRFKVQPPLRSFRERERLPPPPCSSFLK